MKVRLQQIVSRLGARLPVFDRAARAGCFWERTGDRRKGVGAVGEEAAERALKALGYDIIERNWRTRLGELDLVCRHEAELIFVEVKSRRRLHGTARVRLFDNVTEKKKVKLRRLAELYVLKHKKFRHLQLRIDVIGVLLNPANLKVLELQHLKGVV